MVEFEKKCILTGSEYEQLCKIYKDCKEYTQVNYYYDTDDYSYNKKGITCRIRKKGGRYKATIKNHSAGKTFCSVEKSIPVKNELDDTLFKDLGVSLQGYLTTERREISTGYGVTIFLDKNTYIGIIDYELEIEFPPNKELLCNDTISSIVMNLGPKIEYVPIHRFSGQEVRSKVKNTYENRLVDFYERIRKSKSKSQRFFDMKEWYYN